MATLHAAGLAHAHALVAAGHYDSTSAWSFSAEDGNALLGPDGSDWANYSQWFMGEDAADGPADTKAHWKYPFGKDGKVYTSALSAIASRGSAQGDHAISAAATALHQLIDAKEAPKASKTPRVRQPNSVERAWSKFEIKSVDATKRILTGIATTPSTDSYGDVVHPEGAKYALPMPFLWQHDSEQPVGHVIAATPSSKGIDVAVQIASIDEPGALKDRLDTAWQSIKSGLVRGLSIGFRSLEETYDKTTGGFNFLKWQWVELSAVTIPANADCSIQTIRSLDTTAAALGRPRVAVRHTSGASDRPTKPMSQKKTLAQQIADWEATRVAKCARMDELVSKDDGLTMTAAEIEEHDGLAADVRDLDATIERLKAAEQRAQKSAQAVVGTTTTQASESRGIRQISVTSRVAPGINFARYAMCVAMARGNEFEARELAKRNYGDNSAELIKLIDFQMLDPIQRQAAMQQRAAVGGAATSVSGWASELVPYAVMDDFINYLRPLTILGKLGGPIPGGAGGNYPNLRQVPFNTRVSGFNAGTTANWIGEGLPITLSKATSFTTSLTWSKLGALAVLTKEEIRFSNPNAEMKVRDDIALALVQKMDHDLIDPAKAASANVSPSSITYQTTPILTTGTTAATLRTDLATLLATFAALNFSLDDIVLIMTQKQALNISLMVSSLGVPLFPQMTPQGGVLVGIPVIATNQPASIGSPISDIIVGVKAGEIYLADDGVVTVDASDQASVEMVDSSSQTGVSGTGASLVSFWQTGLLGLKVTREVNWKLRRTGAARYIYNVNYSA
jgi:HK97 family phage major capsid protein/HK97 family phage prohead protease